MRISRRKRKSLSLGKKGNAVIDTIFIVITIFSFVIITIFGKSLINDINTEVQASDLGNQTKEQIGTFNDDYPSFFDNLFLTMFILLWLVSLIASYLIDSSPVFFIVVIILLIFLLFFGAVLSNTFEEMSADSSFVNGSFPIMTFIMTNLPLFVLFIAFSIGIVLYGKNRFVGGGL